MLDKTHKSSTLIYNGFYDYGEIVIVFFVALLSFIFIPVNAINIVLVIITSILVMLILVYYFSYAIKIYKNHIELENPIKKKNTIILNEEIESVSFTMINGSPFEIQKISPFFILNIKDRKKVRFNCSELDVAIKIVENFSTLDSPIHLKRQAVFFFRRNGFDVEKRGLLIGKLD